MSIPEYVKHLESGQLERCIELCNERIKMLDDEKKVVLWSVSDEILNYRFFTEDNYIEAAKYLVKRMETNADTDCRRTLVSIDKHLVPESKLSEYLTD